MTTHNQNTRYYDRARNKDLKVGDQVTAQNQIWPVTLDIWPVTNHTKNIRLLMFEDSGKDIICD